MKPKLNQAFACLTVLTLAVACTKNPNPDPPIHDTVYTPKPDTTVNLKKGLLVYLPFSGNIADSSGNNNPTTAVGSVLTYDAHGYANNAFGASTGQRVYVVNNGSIKFDTAYSLSFGFTVNDTTKQATFVSLVDPTTGAGVTFNIGFTTTAHGRFSWGTEDASLGCSQIGKNDPYNIIDTTNFIPVPGAWYNAIATYNKGVTKIYINGVMIYTKTSLGHTANLCPTGRLIVGAWWDNDPLAFNGKVDNVRLYGRLLTPNEIIELSKSYQVTSNSVRPGLQTN